ncbi:AAA family ATPase [Ramlibacter sp. H39-3-26]|uniref:AAA family ATPase n=1 Tax=Curvibacter soli TaxID=3031331 RepID=UPI0023D9CD03|nr:AAA family ATPase [Ramlibacter sp. H39-3-26]MDF1484650.1 AAA family ATPase [Ramlibacter sp. H39-3-26]
MTIRNGTELAEALRRRLAADTGAPVQRIDTHISHILLTRDAAYKLKRPVRLPFVDFTAPAARRHFCEEELRLNQRLAPALYVGVLPVCGTAGDPRLGGPGEENQAIDWVLHMRRFPAGCELDALARQGALAAADIDRFAHRLARFHAGAPPAPPAGAWGTPQCVARSIAGVLDALAPHVPPARLEPLRRWFAGQQAALQSRWAARLGAGWVRECHGDLHLANVVRLGDDVTAFDCIEFDPALRWIDVMADIAFFTMDLKAHGLDGLAWRFLDGYLADTGDYAGLPLLPCYEVYRALVRELAGRLRGGAPDPARPDYLAHAEALAHPADSRPRLLITHGLSGAGKSTAAAALLQTAGAVRLRSDVERKRLFGLPAQADSRGQGQDIYTPEATARTFAQLRQGAHAALAAGYPVIVDAAFLRRQERDDFRALARELGVPFAILHCHADGDTLRQRIARRQAAGNDPSEASVEVLADQERHAEPLELDELPCTLDLPTGAPWSAQTLGTCLRSVWDPHAERRHVPTRRWLLTDVKSRAGDGGILGAMNTTTLTDAQRLQLRTALEQRKAQLLVELGDDQRDVLQALGGLEDQAEPAERTTVRDAEATRDHDELVAVRAALARMADGSYGDCTACGGFIGLQRLLAQPAAARCIACQSKAEAAVGH